MLASATLKRFPDDRHYLDVRPREFYQKARLNPLIARSYRRNVQQPTPLRTEISQHIGQGRDLLPLGGDFTGSPEIDKTGARPYLFSIEAYCGWTSRLLKALNAFDLCVQQFFACTAMSHILECAGEEFLIFAGCHADSLVVSMANFELAILRIEKGDRTEYQIDWDRNPEEVFQALSAGANLPPLDFTFMYRTDISMRLPHWMRCFRQLRPEATSFILDSSEPSVWNIH